MAKTMIDIDGEALERAQRVLLTTTKKDTVNAALRTVVALEARRADLGRLTSDAKVRGAVVDALPRGI